MIDAHNKLIGLSGLSRRLGLSIRWLRDEADAGRIPSLRAGHILLFDVAAVERALLARAAQASPSSEDEDD